MRHRILSLLVGAAAAALPACAAPAREAVLPAAECSCGQPETDALGCPAICCAGGDASCANALCTCAGHREPERPVTESKEEVKS